MAQESFALYRKYRPTTFDEIVDQDHITHVLKAAIERKAIPHALLFSGGRGTGKTTIARIFARALGTDDSDMYEMDAASNRGIDHIRDLRESVQTLPYLSAYKVYIIDEAHMLTKEAFNALLKTLEEPPAHVIFILATTEKDALPETIISRCQVFDFRTPTYDRLSELILRTAAAETFTVSPSVARYIARASDGSYRDALGILQKIMMVKTEATASDDELAALLGIPTDTIVTELFTAFATKSTETGLRALAHAVSLRVNAYMLYTLLLEHIRSTLLLRYRPDIATTVSASLSPEIYERVHEHAMKKDSPINSHLLAQLLSVRDQFTYAPLPTLPLEIILIEHCA